MTISKITANSLATGTIATVNMADGSVTSLKIADGGVGTADIANAAITSAKLDTNIAIANLNTTGSVVFNDAGADVDFRVEGDTEPNLLSVDASTDRVGIGTNTPSAKLDVRGTIQVTPAAVDQFGVQMLKTGTSTTIAGFYQDTSNNGVLALYNGSGATSVDLSGATANALKLDSSGNVGIGTSSPAGILDVSGTTPVVTASQSSTAVTANTLMGAFNAYSYDSSTTSSGGVGSIRVYAEADYNTSNTPSYMSFYTHATSVNDATLLGNPTERMRITSAGNVGIGTSSPGSRLTVSNTRSSDTTLLFLQASGTGQTNDKIGIIFNQNTGADGVAYNLASVKSINTNTSGANGILAFYTMKDTVLSERMRIDYSGNVLIGTTTGNLGTGFSGKSYRLVVGSQGGSGGFGAGGYAAPSGTASFVVGNNFAYRVTIFSTESSVAARIGQYVFVGLNKGVGINPVVLTLGTTGSPQWSFSYTLNGSYDTLVTVNAGSDNQGTRVIVEQLGNP